VVEDNYEKGKVVNKDWRITTITNNQQLNPLVKDSRMIEVDNNLGTFTIRPLNYVADKEE